MTHKILFLLMIAWSTTAVSGGEELVAKHRLHSAVDYLVRAEKLLDHHFNVGGKALTMVQRQAMAKRVLARSKGVDDETLVGIALINELLRHSPTNGSLPFWAVAGLHYQVFFQGGVAVDGMPLRFATLLNSRGVVPHVRDLIKFDGKKVTSGCMYLYSELCFVALKGVRSKSPVALKKMMSDANQADSVAPFKALLNVTDDNDLQDWYEGVFKKAVRQRVWTGVETLNSFSAAIVGLTPGGDAEDPLDRVRDLTKVDRILAKAFVTEVLRIANSAPLTMRPSINRLTGALLKVDDANRWTENIIVCWKELKSIGNSLEAMDARLGQLDADNRSSLLQRMDGQASSNPTDFESAVSRTLDESVSSGSGGGVAE